MRYVNVYLEELAFGGREEGGWWYHTFTPEEGHINARYTPEAEAREDEWVRDQNEGQPPLHSVSSRGLYRVVVENHKAYQKPLSRPRYE